MTRCLPQLVLVSGGLLFAACSGATSPEGDAGFDAGTVGDAGENAWAVAHNAERAAAMPVPNPALPPMTWDPATAEFAGAWANNCHFMHNPELGPRGENIFAGTGAWSATKVVDSWASEKDSFTFATNTCAAGMMCGHYTQLVWRKSVQLGCASSSCTTNSPFGGNTPWTFVVCDYLPAGNIVGQKPY
jgi:pathogenesis-related protein 1